MIVKVNFNDITSKFFSKPEEYLNQSRSLVKEGQGPRYNDNHQLVPHSYIGDPEMFSEWNIKNNVLDKQIHTVHKIGNVVKKKKLSEVGKNNSKGVKANTISAYLSKQQVIQVFNIVESKLNRIQRDRSRDKPLPESNTNFKSYKHKKNYDNQILEKHQHYKAKSVVFESDFIHKKQLREIIEDKKTLYERFGDNFWVVSLRENDVTYKPKTNSEIEKIEFKPQTAIDFFKVSNRNKFLNKDKLLEIAIDIDKIEQNKNIYEAASPGLNLNRSAFISKINISSPKLKITKKTITVKHDPNIEQTWLNKGNDLCIGNRKTFKKINVDSVSKENEEKQSSVDIKTDKLNKKLNNGKFNNNEKKNTSRSFLLIFKYNLK